MMRFDDAIKTCFRNYVTFSGRAQRSEYWFFMLFNLLGSIANSILDAIVFGVSEDGGAGPFSLLFSLAMLLPVLSVTARRLHDLDKSAWWMAAPYGALAFALLSVAFNLNIFAAASGVAALVLLLLLLVWTIMKGTQGPNRFGEDPLA